MQLREQSRARYLVQRFLADDGLRLAVRQR